MTWTAERARRWYDQRPWPCGFNYLPSTAVNSTEMWQAETFDPAAIDRELGWAGAIGLNTCRVFLPFLVWEHDPSGLASRMDRFLGIAARHGLSVMPILFDDCAFAGKPPSLGPQNPPVPGVHNSGWTPSPGRDRVRDPSAWPGLERYVTGLLARFGRDERVLVWDLYNEPGAEGLGNHSLPLLREAFGWARAAGLEQPLTVGTWSPHLTDVNAFSWESSDLLSFHCYEATDALERQVSALKAWDRPILCTEWMRRTEGGDIRGVSRFETHLPLLRRERVGCYFWGLVNGKTQTHFPWGSAQWASDPDVWFHDLLGPDGTPHREEEIALLRAEIARSQT